jgi:hypothetical protein
MAIPKAVNEILSNPKVGEVSIWLDSVQDELNRLDSNIQRLTGMLSPISNCHTGDGACRTGETPEEVLCPVAGKLRQFTKELRMNNQLLESQIDSIEL